MNDEGIKRVKRADAALKKLAQDAQQLREAAERRARPKPGIRDYFLAPWRTLREIWKIRK